MELETSGEVGNSEAAPVETPASGSEGVAGGAESPPAAPEYTPNYKYKFVNPEGKDTEAEIDDQFKPLIKSADDEKKLRDIFEKSSSLDFIKGTRAQLQQAHHTTTTELNSLKSGIDQLRNFVQNDDFESFFQTLNIPKQKILQYALTVAQYDKMSPEQRQAYDSHINSKRQMMQLQAQNQQLSQNVTHAEVQARTQELDMTLGRPDIAAMVSAIDSKGGPGAFRNEVIRRGQLYWHQNQQDVPTNQLVSEVIQHYQNFLTPPTAPGGVGSPAIVQPNVKPVLPNISGRGTSPAKKVPKSIADLQQRARELANQ